MLCCCTAVTDDSTDEVFVALSLTLPGTFEYRLEQTNIRGLSASAPHVLLEGTFVVAPIVTVCHVSHRRC